MNECLVKALRVVYYAWGLLLFIFTLKKVAAVDPIKTYYVFAGIYLLLFYLFINPGDNESEGDKNE